MNARNYAMMMRSNLRESEIRANKSAWIQNMIGCRIGESFWISVAVGYGNQRRRNVYEATVTKIVINEEGIKVYFHSEDFIYDFCYDLDAMDKDFFKSREKAMEVCGNADGEG